MQKNAPSAGRIAIAAAFALSCFGLLMFLWTAFGGPVPLRAQSYRFHAIYPEAAQLVNQADVRIGGVSVGKVVNREPQIGFTKAELEIDPKFAPIPRDTRTRLRTKTLVGEVYVELTPGTPLEEGGEPLPEGATLPRSRTSTGIEIDEVLRAADPQTRESLKGLAEELADAADGRGGSISGFNGSLGPFSENAGRVSAVLRSQRRQFRRLVRDAGVAATALTVREGQLRDLIDAGSRVLEATASRNEALTETVRIFPTTLSEFEPTLALAREVGAEAQPLLEELDPAIQFLGPALRDLNAAAPGVRAVLNDLGPVTRRGRTAVPALRKILAEAQPLVDRLYPATLDLVPALQFLEPYKREAGAGLIKFGQAINATGPSGDGQRRNLLRTMIPFWEDGLTFKTDVEPENRHNPYFRPGYLDELRNGLRAFDCLNARQSINAPPCVDQGPLPSGTRFPQLRKRER